MDKKSMIGDYIGFTFGGIHSSELGVIRVSDGSRYEQDLLPPLQDKKVQIAGQDGEIFFGSNHGSKEIKLLIAFENLSEEGLKKITDLLADKKLKSLWFDETPYKEWIVKSAEVQELKYIVFTENHNGREVKIYKGEGTLIFRCFNFYAQSRATYHDAPVDFFLDERGIYRKEQLITNRGSGFSLRINSEEKLPLKLKKYQNYRSEFCDQEGNIYSTIEPEVTVLSQLDKRKLGVYYSSSRYEAPHCLVGVPGYKDEEAKYYLERRVLIVNDLKDFVLHDSPHFLYSIRGKDIFGDENFDFYDCVGLDYEDKNTKDYFIFNNSYYSGYDMGYIVLFENNKELFLVRPFIDKQGKPNFEITDYKVFLFTRNTPILSDFSNYYEWNSSSYLLRQTSTIYLDNEHFFEEWFQKTRADNKIINIAGIYNCGDVDSNIILKWSDLNQRKQFLGDTILLLSEEQYKQEDFYSDKKISIKPFQLKKEDAGIEINLKLKLIRGIDVNGKFTGNIYSNYADFKNSFQLPSWQSLNHQEDNVFFDDFIEPPVISYIVSESQLEYDLQYKHYYT